MLSNVSRRRFLAVSAAGGAGFDASVRSSSSDGKLAVLGGTPVRAEKFPSWPVTDAMDEQNCLDVLRSGRWTRGQKYTAQFEQAYAELMGARYCLSIANGTSALYTSLFAVGVSPGDEVILPPYTFVATLNVILLHYALPVFVDSDRETFQMDARKLEAAITPRTKAIVPVHIGGSAAELDMVLAVGKKHNIPVIEDACQAHLGEWRGRRLGSLGTTGCFSFQASKNLNCGEGGAILTSDEDVYGRCHSFHNNGRSRTTGAYVENGGNLRTTQFQTALLLSQMSRLQQQAKTRDQNGAYLTSMLKEIPGIVPARMYGGCTRNAYHLYMFRYEKERFAGTPRTPFLKALAAEGIPCSGGYRPLNKEAFLKKMLQSPGYQRIYGRKELAKWEERNQCAENDRLCEEAVWFGQTMLLGSRRDLEQIAEAIRKIQVQAAQLRTVGS